MNQAYRAVNRAQRHSEIVHKCVGPSPEKLVCRRRTEEKYMK